MNMTIDHFTSRFLSLLLALWLVGYCHGQENSQPGRVESPQSVTSTGQPKLLITQGSDKHDNVHAMLQDKTGICGSRVLEREFIATTALHSRSIRSETVCAVTLSTQYWMIPAETSGLARIEVSVVTMARRCRRSHLSGR